MQSFEIEITIDKENNKGGERNMSPVIHNITDLVLGLLSTKIQNYSIYTAP